MVAIFPVTVLYGAPAGPIFPKEYSAKDAVNGKSPTVRAALEDIAKELLSGSPNGKNLRVIFYS